MSSATGRLWANATGGRLELQSDAGDAQIVWSETKVTVYDATSNTAYVADLPQKTRTPQDGSRASRRSTGSRRSSPISPSTGRVSGAQPANVAGQEAYSVTISPSHDGGLLGSAQLAWDAMHGVPLASRSTRRARRARCSRCRRRTSRSAPSRRPTSRSRRPPARRSSTSRRRRARARGAEQDAPVTGLAAVQAAAPFAVVAPDTLVGLPRRDVRLVGPADGRSAVVVYGQGLGAIVVVERKHDATVRGGAPARHAGRAAVDLTRRRDRTRALDAARHGARLGPRRRRRTCSRDRSHPRLRSRRRARSSERRVADRSARARQALRRHRRRRPRRPDRRARRRVRLPRPERRGQDDVAAHAARAHPPHRGSRTALRSRSDDRRRASTRRRRRLRRRAAVLPVPLRPAQPPPARRSRRRRARDAHRRGARRRRAARPRGRPGRRLLARHAPAARDRGGAAASAEAAAARRARDRPRPGGHAGHARADQAARRGGHHDPPLEPHPRRGGGALQSRRDRPQGVDHLRGAARRAARERGRRVRAARDRP